MKKLFSLLSLLMSLFFSCKKEDDLPEIYLEGVYENTRLSNVDPPRYLQVLVMTFSRSGNVLIENFVTPADTEERCLSSYNEGTYSLRGEVFKMVLTSAFGPDPSIELSGDCFRKDQLISSKDPYYQEFTGSLVLGKINESFLLTYPCIDSMQVLSDCLGPETYLKVR
ncbi:hypothetical protein LZF95_16500 [Algoriphagus sp. AGSA1]|uniref:hypothetical protein n=1 Tax=unclassified Algoriphagus TaxID=2641541 RepID=UPI00177AF52F|nr:MULTISPECIES: hypothetical protein [unclassified Algoriphagus]MCE7056284.1 hypothetical protein [Algoriphagus sp. AGSA1]